MLAPQAQCRTIVAMGTSHLAIELAVCACLAYKRVLFTAATMLFDNLVAGHAANTLGRLLQTLRAGSRAAPTEVMRVEQHQASQSVLAWLAISTLRLTGTGPISRLTTPMNCTYAVFAPAL